MISETTENRDLVDERGWVNSFGDNGWSFTKGSAPLVCFSITPRGSQLLRELLKKGPVKVRANVDSRYYAGVYPYVTGVIRGTDGANAEEVLSLGHLFEQGAHDNATGVASIIGAAETLNRLITAGKLPRPKRTIRVLGMGECYGTMYYLEHNTDRVKRTDRGDVHRLTGRPAESRRHRVHLDPESAFRQVVRGCLRAAPGGGVLPDRRPAVARRMEHRSSTDNYLGDPSIGIPTVMPHGGYGVLAHHNSDDTPATVDPKSLRDLMVMNAAYTYFIASAGPAEKRWMAEVALTRGYDQVAAAAEKTAGSDRDGARTAETLGRLLQQGARADRLHARSRESQAVRSAWDLKEGLADLAAFAQQQKARVERAIRDRASALGLGRDPADRAARAIPRRRRSSCAASAWARSRSTICRASSARAFRPRRSGACPCRRSTGAMASATWRRSSG